MANNHFSNIFNRAYVINLEDRIDRKIKMIHKLEQINIQYQFVKAVDTRNDSEKLTKLIETTDYRKIGEIGYKETFQKIIKDAIKNEYETIICFDDDVLFHKNFHNKFEEKIKHIPENWEILYLGASEWSNKDLDNFSGEYYYPTLEYDSKFGDGTCGSYAIAFKRSFLLKFYDYLVSFDNAFDRVLVGYIKSEQMKNVYVMYPNLAIAEIADSDIRKNWRSLEDHCKKVHWTLNDYEYPMVKKRPLITAAIITKNRSKLLKKCLDSIFKQKMVVNGKIEDFDDFEVAVIDDGSEDDTLEMLKKYKENVGNKLIYKSGGSGGIPKARNKVNELSNGYYIAVVDDDDIQLPYRLYNHIKAINGTFDNEIGSYGGWINYDINTKEMQVNHGKHRSFNTIAFLGSVMIHPATCYRKDITKEFQYNENYPFNSDYDLAIRLAHENKKMNHCGDYLIIRIMHGGNVTFSHDGDQKNYSKMARDKIFALYTNDDINLMRKKAKKEVIDDNISIDRKIFVDDIIKFLE